MTKLLYILAALVLITAICNNIQLPKSAYIIPLAFTIVLVLAWANGWIISKRHKKY